MRNVFGTLALAACLAVGCGGESRGDLEITEIRQGLQVNSPYSTEVGVIMGRMLHPFSGQYVTGIVYQQLAVPGECSWGALDTDYGLTQDVTINGTNYGDSIFLLAPFQNTNVDCNRSWGVTFQFVGAPSTNAYEHTVTVEAGDGDDFIECDGNVMTRLECNGGGHDDTLVTGHYGNFTHLQGFWGNDKLIVNQSSSWINVEGYSGNDCLQSSLSNDHYIHVNMDTTTWGGMDKCTQNWSGCEQIVSSCLF
jgi:hypothetical protein